MNEIFVSKNKKVNLSVALPDYATDKFLRCKILDVDGSTLIDTITLIHSSDGIYVNTDWVFPSDKSLLIAVIEVFEDESFTIESTYKMYTFGLNASANLGGGSNSGGGGVIVGKIYSNKINEVLKSKKIISKIKNNTVSTVIKNNKIIASVTKDDFIKGEIDG